MEKDFHFFPMFVSVENLCKEDYESTEKNCFKNKIKLISFMYQQQEKVI
jgi:hypothetical protein